MTRKNPVRFQRFLNNPLNKTSDGKLLNTLANSKHIKLIIEDLCITEEVFYSASITTLNIWSVKLQDRPSFARKSNIRKFRILNTFQIFIYFCYSIDNIKKSIKFEKQKIKTIIKNPTLIKVETSVDTTETNVLPIFNISININLIQKNPFLLNYHYTSPPFFPSLYQHNTFLKAA